MQQFRACAPTIKKDPKWYKHTQEKERTAPRMYRLSYKRKIYVFRGLEKFIKTHPDLFYGNDAIYVKSGKMTYCPAHFNLSRLHPQHPSRKPFWKGWTWVKNIINNHA